MMLTSPFMMPRRCEFPLGREHRFRAVIDADCLEDVERLLSEDSSLIHAKLPSYAKSFEWPLESAVNGERSLDVVHTLLRHGACVNAVGAKGCTPLETLVRVAARDIEPALALKRDRAPNGNPDLDAAIRHFLYDPPEALLPHGLGPAMSTSLAFEYVSPHCPSMATSIMEGLGDDDSLDHGPSKSYFCDIASLLLSFGARPPRSGTVVAGKSISPVLASAIRDHLAVRVVRGLCVRPSRSERDASAACLTSMSDELFSAVCRYLLP